MLRAHHMLIGMPWDVLIPWNKLLYSSHFNGEARISLNALNSQQLTGTDQSRFNSVWRCADLYFPGWTVELANTTEIGPHIWFQSTPEKNFDICEPLYFARQLLARVLEEAKVDPGHGIDHAVSVLEHAHNALLCEPGLSLKCRIHVLFSALLHDADDDKLFHAHNNDNAIYIVSQCNAEFPHLKLDIDLIIQMIELVGTAKNGNSKVSTDMKWMLIPRWCDRLEACGEIGVKRTIHFANSKNLPMSLPSTPKVFNDTDIDKVAPYSRFLNYGPTTRSPSVIDHLYDKILHIGLRPEDTQNEYLLDVSQQRSEFTKQFIFDYWQKQ